MILRGFLTLLSFCVYYCVSDSVPCAARDNGNGGVVCVCNATYCDTVEPNVKLPRGHVAVYSTTHNKTLDKHIGKFEDRPVKNVRYIVKPNVTYQTIQGFGGAFTDAAGINIMSLSEKAQDNLLKSYYSPSGIEYTIGRVPMASCDFSTHAYSYDDHPMDFDLKHFALAPEDLKFKIPIINRAKKLNSRKMFIFGSPWSAPAWMKTDHNMTGKGSLIGTAGGKYYKTWANYFVRFLKEYEKHGISFWGLTAQNEPTDGEIYHFSFQAMGWTAEQQRDFIAKDLGPALHANGYDSVKLMILDDQRLFLHMWAETILSDAEAAKYISGAAVHWYIDEFVPADILTKVHDQFPDKFLFASEACTGSMPWEQKVVLGSLDRGISYGHDIIQDLNHWVTGWTDWNIALDMEGGPNWVKNFVDSPIIVNAKKGEFYKQPMFYGLGHISKFIVPGSKRIQLIPTPGLEQFDIVAFILPDSSIAVVVVSRWDETMPLTLDVSYYKLGYFNMDVPAKSMHTIIWWHE